VSGRWIDACCGACFLEDVMDWSAECEGLNHRDVEAVFWELAEEGLIIATSVGGRRKVQTIATDIADEARLRLRALDARKRLTA